MALFDIISYCFKNNTIRIMYFVIGVNAISLIVRLP